MSEVGTAVPANVNLAKHKPYAVSAYSRRVKSIANNAQSFGPDSYVNITLDTSTPGSFLDPLSSYLKFDINITNTNVFADYVSFGNAGAASVIEEFRIYVQGTPIEEILQYNLFYELAMNQNGQTQQPFHIFRPNSSQLGVSDLFHLNAIKAPMVDMDGRPMWGSVKNSIGARGRAVAWAYALDSNLSSAKMIQSQASTALQVNFGIRKPTVTGAGSDNFRGIFIADPHSLLYGQGAATADAGMAAYTANGAAGAATNAGVFPAVYGAGPFSTFTGSIDTITDMTDQNTSSIGLDAYSSTCNYTGGDIASFAPYLTTRSGILPFSGTTVEFPSMFGETRPEVYSPDLDPKNPLNWCSFLPASEIRPETKTLGPDNLQDYMMFLSNTKYIPIGMPGLSKEVESSFSISGLPPADEFSATATSNNFKNLRAYSGTSNGNAVTYTYTCCIPLISGVLGSFADKCWPTMLIAPGSMYIQIRTATPQKAFQLSMDPCRRVLGTIRDYVPYGGTMGGLFGQLGNNGASAFIGNAGSTAVGYIGDAESGGNELWGCLPNDTTCDYLATQSLTVSAGYSAATRAAQKVATKSNGYCCIGAALASASQGITSSYLTPNAGSNTGTGIGLMFRPYSVAALEGRWTIGRAYVLQNSNLTNTGTGTFTYPAGAYPANTAQAISVSTTSPIYSTEIESSMVYPATSTYGTTIAPALQYANFINSAGWGTTQSTGVSTVANSTDLATSVNVKFSPSGIPLPQYWLHAAPWTKKNLQCDIPALGDQGGSYRFWGSQHIDCCSEALACYGTYLTASVPQSRRVLTHIQNPSTELVTYSLSNIEFVSQQIILPDSVSASILQQAAAGDISITSNSLHNYQTPIAISDNQNLIIPAKIASANTMYCLFVPQAFVSGNGAYAYNSLRGINPFASVSATNANGTINSNGFTNIYDPAVGLGYDAGQLVVQNTSAGSGAFQIQLKIGNELIPQQPLTTVTELVTENIKAQHKLFDSASNVNVTYALSNTRVQRYGATSVSGLSFDALQPRSFCTTFVSAELLDDQTAINNPCSAHIYAAEAAYRLSEGRTAKTISDYVINRRPHCLELLQPPESSFVITFDMDTWSRYNEVTRSGKFLGNNTITLSLTGATELGLTNAVTGSGGFVLQTFVVHDIRFSFQAGGSVVSYY